MGHCCSYLLPKRMIEHSKSKSTQPRYELLLGNPVSAPLPFLLSSFPSACYQFAADHGHAAIHPQKPLCLIGHLSVVMREGTPLLLPDVGAVVETLNSVTDVHNSDFIIFAPSASISCSPRCKLRFFSTESECAWEKSHADSAVIGRFKRSLASCPNISLDGNGERRRVRISSSGQAEKLDSGYLFANRTDSLVG